MAQRTVQREEQCAYLLALMGMKGIPRGGLRAALLRGLTPREIYSSRWKRLIGPEKATLAMVDRLRERVAVKDYWKEVRSLAEKDYGMVDIQDSRYPARLREIRSAPLVLWYRGCLEATSGCCLAIVGTRAASKEGLVRARQLTRALTRAGIVVVSGLARGIDTAAHWAAMQAGGTTAAVVGTGVDIVYPPENEELGGRIVESGGTIISEFEPGSGPQRWHFPQRNRTMTGLCEGTVVIEASATSGARYQAEYTIEQGRSLFLVRSQIERFDWARDAAESYDKTIVVDHVADVLRHLGV